MPAQHASRSMAPKRSTAPRISASMSPARDTSATLPSTAPSPRSSREACSTLGASFEQKTTLAPPRARRSTVARPIPVEPPVTTATFPLKSASSATLLPPRRRRLRPCERLRPASLRQHQLVVLVDGLVHRRARIPLRDRLLAGLVERLHRRPHHVDLVGEEVADQEIGDLALQVREALHELAEAEAVVVLAHEPAHAVDALVEGRPPL